jgi:hypothetical protein
LPQYLEAFKHIMPYLSIGARALAVLGLLSLALLGIQTIRAIPVSIKVQAAEREIEYAGFIKSVIYLIILAIAVAHCLLVALLPLLVAAKIGFIEFLVAGILGCWIGILNSGRWAKELVLVQTECELATNLTFLQGEMVRAQLEDVNDRIRKQLEPQEIDATKTLLQTMSPLMMLFVQKEKSIMKWSLAAVNAGKMLTKYFNSPKK